IVSVGHDASFAAAASGFTEPGVQWQVDSGDGFADMDGATAATLTVHATAADDGNHYRAVFRNRAGEAPTDAATLTVLTAPLVTADPADSAVPAGGTAHFSAAAIGNPTPTVQWQASSDGETFTNLPGENGSVLDVQATLANDGKYYRAHFTNAVGSADSRR